MTDTQREHRQRLLNGQKHSYCVCWRVYVFVSECAMPFELCFYVYAVAVAMIIAKQRQFNRATFCSRFFIFNFTHQCVSFANRFKGKLIHFLRFLLQ